jgi:hypothetical protein
MPNIVRYFKLVAAYFKDDNHAVDDLFEYFEKTWIEESRRSGDPHVRRFLIFSERSLKTVIKIHIFQSQFRMFIIQ